MIVKKMQSGGEFPQYSITGNILSIDGQTYDLSQLQEEEQNIIEIKDDDRFLAVIIIPPATHIIEEAEPEEGVAIEGTVINISKVPLDMRAVQLILWAKEEHNKTEGEV